MFTTIYTPGAMVCVLFEGFRHYAIVSDRYINSLPMLISLSDRTGTVREEPWEVCAQGRRVELAEDQGNLPWWLVLMKARNMFGKIGYRLWDQNCEHFARWTHGLKVESKQVQGFVIGALAVGALVLCARN